MFALRKIAYFLCIIHWCNASNIERIDIHIDKLRLTNILYGSTELAHLRCNECLSNNTHEFIEGSLVLNGFGSRFISMPKKNYRFNYNNESIVLVNAIEPGRISTSLFNTLTEAAGGNAIYQQFIELYINNVYNGLYYTKHMSFAVNYTEVFKIETDAVPDNSYLLSDLDINTNMDHSYNIFSYISSLFAVDDMTMHNYAILRNGHEND